ncbi:uncharacterized protein LOC115466496 [Microcaecilia unicolor]|uniref:Uncharacterized protein LOC115466496 n=1 Tax=Microcaecilia unicolor TaxID=1415580 RepID=A0A6P7XK68_9AMPH|nr:uncharacterized protein LOC115466496 [Microcaecilia unicolor]
MTTLNHNQIMETFQQGLEGHIWLVSQWLTSLPRAEKLRTLKKCQNRKHGLDLAEVSRMPGVRPLGCKKFQNPIIPEKPDDQKHFNFCSCFKKKLRKPDNRYMRFLMTLKTPVSSQGLKAKSVHKHPRQGFASANSPAHPKIPPSKSSPQKLPPRNPATLQEEKIRQLLPTLLKKFPAGLRIPRLEDVVRREYGIDLATVIQDLRYPDTRSFLLQIANIMLLTPARGARTLVKYRKEVGRGSGKDFVHHPRGSQHSIFPVQMAPADRKNEILRLIHQSLHKTSGLQIKKLKGVLWTQHGIDLEKVSRDLNYKNALCFLQQAPTIQLSDPTRKDKCVVRIDKGINRSSLLISPYPLCSGQLGNGLQDTSLQGPAVTHPFQASQATLSQAPVAQTSNSKSVHLRDLVQTLIHQILYKTCGFEVKKLMQVLLIQHKVDLEKVSHYLGYKDALSFLQKIPNIQLSDPDKGSKCLVVLEKGVKPQPLISTSLPAPYPKEGEVILPPYSKAETVTSSANVPASHPEHMPNVKRFTTTNVSPRSMRQPNHYVRPTIRVLTRPPSITYPNQYLFAKDTHVSNCGVIQLPHAAPVRVQFPVTNPLGQTRQITLLLPSGAHLSSTPSLDRFTQLSQNSHATKPEEIEGWKDDLQQKTISWEKSMPTKPAGLKKKDHVFPHQGASSTPSCPDRPVEEYMKKCPDTQVVNATPPPLQQDMPSDVSQNTHVLKHLPANSSSFSQRPGQSVDGQCLPSNEVATDQLSPVLISVPLPISSPIVPLVQPTSEPQVSESVRGTSLVTRVLPPPRSLPNQPLGNGQLNYLGFQQQMAPISTPMTGIRVRNSFPMPSPGFQTPSLHPKATTWLSDESSKTYFASPSTSVAAMDSTYLEMHKAEESSRYNSSGDLAGNTSLGCKEEPGPSHSSFSISMPASTSGQSPRKPLDDLPKNSAPVIPPKPAALPVDQKTIPGLDKIGKLLSLPEFASGIRVEKLNEIMKKRCKIDLEKLGKEQGCKDIISFLQRLPNIKLSDPGKWSTCIVKLQKASQNGAKATCEGQNPFRPVPTPQQPTEKAPIEGWEDSAPTWSPNRVTPSMIQEATSWSMEANQISAPPQGPNLCPHEHLDPILKEEVLVVLLQKPRGVTFGQFAGVFHKTHGYQLKLSKHGYKSLQSLLDDMKDLVEVLNKGTKDLVIRCRFPSRHRLVEIFPSGPKSGFS